MSPPEEHPAPPDCVVFDLDGTLADTAPDLIAAANACFRALGLGAPLHAGDGAAAYQGARAMLRLGHARLGREATAEDIDAQVARLILAYEGAIAIRTRLCPGALVAVRTLRRRGHALAVCTNKPERLAEALLEALGVRDLFDALVGGDTLAVAKPDPAPYFLAVRRAGGNPRRSVMVGDSETDLLTARAAGVPACLVNFGPMGRDSATLAPDAIIDDLAALPDVVAALLGGGGAA